MPVAPSAPSAALRAELRLLGSLLLMIDCSSLDPENGLLARARRLVACGLVAFALWPPASARAAEPATEPGAPRVRTTSLDELAEFARQHGAEARRARQRRAFGAAARVTASAFLHENPTLTVGAGPRWVGDERALDVQASLAQPVEVAGERGLRRAAAARFAERLDAEVAVAELALQRDVRLAYREAQVARERSVFHARLRESVERALAVARRRLAAGDMTRIELHVAEADAARARAAELAAAEAASAARVELARISGWSPDAPPEVDPGLEPAPAPAPLEAAPPERDGHPDRMARRAAVREAHAYVELAERRAWPSPTLALQLTREGAAGGPPSYVLLGSVGLPLPLWSQNRAEREQSRADEAQALEEESLGESARRAEQVRAHAALTSAAARVALLDEGVTRALEDGLSLLERSLVSGESSLLDVASARERLSSARLEALDAYADYYRAQAALEHALAAGLAPDRSVAAAQGGAR